MTVQQVPSAFHTLWRYEFAASVTQPNCAAACKIASCASLTVLSIRTLRGDSWAPCFASLSASWLALHSGAITNNPFDFCLCPIISLEVCAHIHTRLPRRFRKSPSSISTIARHILAMGRRAAVAASASAAAVLSSAMQSVMMLGGKGQQVSVSWSAQASPVAAVRTQAGGVAWA